MHKRRYLAGIIMASIFILVTALGLFLTNRAISRQFLAAYGVGVMDYATHLADQITLSDADVEALKKMTFEEAVQSEYNRQLEQESHAEGYGATLKFTYLLTPLSEDEVKYTADKTKAKECGVPEGTPLDVMWLLDLYGEPDDNMRALLEAGTYYDDLRRYSVLSDTERKIVAAREPAYALTGGEWGETLTGLSPVYSVEGTFIGMMGVDLHIEPYVESKNFAMRNLGYLAFLVTGTLCGMFLFIYRKYLRVRDQQLYRDPLTSAYNRRYFNDLFAQTLKVRKNYDKFLVFLMLDIDFFKRVNDQYGHDKGDLCLKAISQAAQRVLGAPPNVLVRYGGEEFLAVLTVSDNNEAETIVRNMITTIRGLDLFGDGYKVTISAGGAVLPYRDGPETNLAFVVKAADDNLYYCKNHGRDQYKITDYTRAKA